MDRHRHAKILTIYNQLMETTESMAFASEPVLGSLANIMGNFFSLSSFNDHFDCKIIFQVV